MAQRWVLISFLCLSLTLFALILVSVSALNAVTLLDENWNGFQLTWSDMQLGVAEGSAVASADQRVVRVDTIVSFLNSMKSVFSGLLVLAVVFLVWAVWTTRNTLSPHRLSASSAVSSERLAIKRLTAELELLKQGDLSTVVSDLDPDTAPVAESVNQLVNEFSSVLQADQQTISRLHVRSSPDLFIAVRIFCFLWLRLCRGYLLTPRSARQLLRQCWKTLTPVKLH